MWVAVLPLQRRTVPAVLLELKLALVNGQLKSLNGGHHDVRIAEAELQLLLAQSGEILTNGRRRTGFATLPLHHRIEKVFVLLLPLLVVRFTSNIHQRITVQYVIGASLEHQRLIVSPSLIATCATT